MKSNRRLMCAVAVPLAMALATLPSISSAQNVKRSDHYITVLTGPSSGIYFPIGGAFSTLIVPIAPGGAMLPHKHEGQVEQHFVVAGEGVADLAGRRVDYAEGALMIIPPATLHSIRAGEAGMTLMALFAPAIN